LARSKDHTIDLSPAGNGQMQPDAGKFLPALPSAATSAPLQQAAASV
jgi:hypothetical protein